MGAQKPSPLRVKRRTTPDPRGTCTAELHRRAFEHAMRMLKPENHRLIQRPRYGRVSGRLVSWATDLHCEPGGATVSASFTCTRGFRFQLGATATSAPAWPACDSSLWAAANFKRFLPYRLQAYRKILCTWQQTAANPLTFRDFNRLLCALSYDLATP
jgi:hypothetical protein